MRPECDASVFRQAGKARAQGLDRAKKKDRKIDVATFVSPGILACIRAKISEHQRENELRPAEAMAKKKSPIDFRHPENKFQADFTGAFGKL